jgi:hypothetical protein
MSVPEDVLQFALGFEGVIDESAPCLLVHHILAQRPKEGVHPLILPETLAVQAAIMGKVGLDDGLGWTC